LLLLLLLLLLSSVLGCCFGRFAAAVVPLPAVAAAERTGSEPDAIEAAVELNCFGTPNGEPLLKNSHILLF
jgi:hypothetical protein